MIKIKYVDWFPAFNKDDFFITTHLLNDLDYVFVENDPDLIIYSSFGKEHLNYTCKKIFSTGIIILRNLRQPISMQHIYISILAWELIIIF